MSSNVVTLYGVVEEEGCTVDYLIRLAGRYGTLWMVRFVPVLQGALLAFSTAEEASNAALHLHGVVLPNHKRLRAGIGRKSVTLEEVAGYNLAAPKRLIQLVSPPPSPPEWWDGWHEHEEGPKTPPELQLDETATRYRLEMVSHALLGAQPMHERDVEQGDEAAARPPVVTLEAPPVR
jgi:hypothetical protein